MTCACGKEAEPGKDECFRCRVASVSFRYIGGGGYGRASFVGRTNQEFLNEHVGDVRREGVEKVDGRVWS